MRRCYSVGGRVCATTTTSRGVQCMPGLVPLVVTTWLVAVFTTGSILQAGDPLELRPPTGEKGLYFGFSLAHYTNNSQKWLLVGAPKSNISDPNVANSGGLYQCPLSESTGAHECHVVNVDLTYNIANASRFDNDSSEQGQSLGFSLAASDKEIVVCAPLWYASTTKFNRKRFIPAGMCYAAKSPGFKFEGFSPPFDLDYTSQINFITTGYCQFGISAAYIKGQDKFAVGAPGCWSWQGGTWEVELNSQSSRHLPQLKREDLNLEIGKWDLYNLYLGYSVASFKFGGSTAIISSIPKSVWLDGAKDETSFGPSILILVQDPTNETTLSVHKRISPSKADKGEIKFSFFGYSLATLDVNGDGLEDLVVGAPLYQPNPGSQGSSADYDCGAIFVYMQIKTISHQSQEPVYEMKEEDNAPQRKGSQTLSRFGSSVAAVGDLDGDGYEDLAVGAPFMDVGPSTGAVYIYMGSHTGLEKDPFQIIKASPNHYGFGSSIAQHLQIVEGKGYAVAVGIYDSDKVMVFKSKEVAEVTWGLHISEPIKLSENRCICIKHGGLCPCVESQVCVLYQGKFNKFENSRILDFSITLATDIGDDLFFNNEETEIIITMGTREDEKDCAQQVIMAKPGKNEIKSYVITAELSLAKEEKDVILDRHAVLKKEEKLNVFIPCKSADITGCKSDIILQCDVLASYVYYSQPIKLKLTIQNEGEIAYDSRLIIESDNAVFKVIETNSSCDNNINKEVECIIGNIYNNSKTTFTLDLAPSLDDMSVATHKPFFAMTAKVVTVSSLSNPDTAVKDFKVNISVPGSLTLFPKDPSIVVFNSSSYYQQPENAKDEQELGPEVKHEYKILNSNDFSIYGADLTIHWPLKIAGKYFLYLLNELDFGEVQASCQYVNGKPDPFGLAARPTRITRSPQAQSEKLKKSALDVRLNNKAPEYMIITCHFGEFKGGNKEVTLNLRSRLVLRTLEQLEVGTAVTNASSFVDLQITQMPFNVPPPEASHSSINTEISYRDDEPEIKVPIWLYIVAVIGGVLVLSILIFILWKCGFFKRTRREDTDKAKEREEQQELTEEEEKLTEGEESAKNPRTPKSPMLNETESTTDEFQYTHHRNQNS